MKTKMTRQEMIAEFYSRGSSRGMCPEWFQYMLRLINESSK